MGKKSRSKREATNNTQPQQGESMSESTKVTVTGSSETLREAQGTKPNPSTGEQPKASEVKVEVEKKENNVISLITKAPSLAWNKAIVPAYEFIKNMAMRAWQGVVDLYNAEVSAFKEMGPTSYFLGRGAKLGIKLFKVIGAAAAVAFINNMLFNLTGISIFDPMTLGIIAFVALVLVIGSSYNAQKKMGGEFDLGTTGRHITEAVLAA